MNIAKYALRFRNTFFVLMLMTAALGGGAIVTMPKDIFPTIDIPVVTVIWTYAGLSTQEMEQRITTFTEFGLSNNVNGIKRIESQTTQGVATEKIYFQPNVSIDLALSQTVAIMNAVRFLLPPGVNPPIIVRYSASSVPVIQLALNSTTASEQKLADYGQSQLRPTIATTPGSTIPFPYGGRARQIMVDLDQHALQSVGITSSDVVSALTAQNITTPSGLAKIGDSQYVVRLNTVPDAIAAMNMMPVKVVKGAPILMRDIANIRDGYGVQQNIVRTDGMRAVLLTILKNGEASTLSVVENVKSLLAGLRAAAPPGIQITPLFDQSVFVSTAINDVLVEGGVTAALTGLMILLFLGSWRSTFVVLISIPLSMLISLVMLAVLGQTMNIMTLGGLALAVGILVDDATVAIENTYRLFDEGYDFKQAVVEGATGIAKPALVSTLSICCAFISVVFLTDAAKLLFMPQALAVVFAMLASYALSRTIVPIFIDVLVKREHDRRYNSFGSDPRGFFGRFHHRFETRLDHFRKGYVVFLRALLERQVLIVSGVILFLATSGTMFHFVGTDYFPQVDAGQMQLHVRGKSGLRIEETERLFQDVEDIVRQTIPRQDLQLIIDNIGLPANNYNLTFSDGSTVGANDGQILIALNKNHASTAVYMRRLRVVLREKFPESTFYFQAADMITQILNFGIQTPIDVRIIGRNAVNNAKVAQLLLQKIRRIRGAVDVHLHQILDAPEFLVNVDRVRAAEFGLTEGSVADALGVSLNSSFQVYPNFWSDPLTGIPYPVAVQTPEYRVTSVADLVNLPLLTGAHETAAPPSLLANVATLRREGAQTVVSHTNILPVLDILSNVADRDLGSIETDLAPILAEAQKQMTPGNKISIQGQIESKNAAFQRIGIGLIAAAIFIYLIMVINFQTWIEPLVVLIATPMVFAGIVIALFATGTSLSISSLFGAIMSVGIASANSILLLSFAKDYREQTGSSAKDAAVMAASTRLRPILMTAIAMFVGLIPMALGIGDGGEQNAALARAVMGGVLFGTVSTLLIVPALYERFRRYSHSKPTMEYF